MQNVVAVSHMCLFRCGNVTNTANLGATSAEDVLQKIDGSLTLCTEQLQKFEEKGRTHLPSYQKVKERMAMLQQSK